MVGGEMKTGSGFSWADEVEKEEEEEARIRTCERQKPNPFGSARPREVVLQEKGIDWRKLDQDLHRSSNARYETPAKKPLKENNPAYSARAAGKKPEISISSGRSLQSKPEIRDLEPNKRKVPGGLLTPPQPADGIFVAPPPRYQTRNVLACLSEVAYPNSRRFDSEEKRFQHRNHIDYLHKNRIEAEREMMFHESQKQQFYNSGGPGIEGYIPHYDDQFVPHNSIIGWEREYTEFHVGGRRYSGVALRRPWMVAGEERRDADTDYNRRKFLKRETLPLPEKRPPSVDHHARNAGIGRRQMTVKPPSNGAVQQQGQWLHNRSGSRIVNSVGEKCT